MIASFIQHSNKHRLKLVFMELRHAKTCAIKNIAKHRRDNQKKTNGLSKNLIIYDYDLPLIQNIVSIK